MDRDLFNKRFPNFSSRISVTFGDESPIDDAKLAREMDCEASPADRILIISEALSEANQFMAVIDDDWKPLRDEANRHLTSPEDAREWLVGIMSAWQEELNRLRGGTAGGSY